MRSTSLLDDEVAEALSPTVGARQLFLARVVKIPGVAAVEQKGRLPTSPVVVYVPALRSETSGQVFDLEAELLRQFPGAELTVHVRCTQTRPLRSTGAPLDDQVERTDATRAA
jgi:hypothetical protein